MRRRHSLRALLLGAMVLTFSLGMLATYMSYRYEVVKLGNDLSIRTLQEQARETLAGLHQDGDGAVRLTPTPAWTAAYADRSGYFTYTLYDSAGRPIARSPNLSAPLPYFQIPKGDAFAPINLIGVGADRRAIIAARAPAGYVLVVGRNDIKHESLVDSLFEEGSEKLLVLLPFVGLALALIWAITWWSLRPITRASREAAAVGPANPTARISTDQLPREVQPLVAAVNVALDRLADAYSRERQITSDAAHALRTPLSVLSLRLQRARHSGSVDWPAVERELSHMSGLVGQLLDLARKESHARREEGAALPTINLSRVVREAAATVLPLIESRGRRLEVDVPETVPVRGHAGDLEDMVRNLLENALVHGRGAISIRVTRNTVGPNPEVTIEVVDEGDGVPVGKEEEAFARFHKLQANSPGSGLGLAIVRQVALNHGGTARFTPGRGQVIVSLPQSALPVAPRAPGRDAGPADSSRMPVGGAQG